MEKLLTIIYCIYIKKKRKIEGKKIESRSEGGKRQREMRRERKECAKVMREGV